MDFYEREREAEREKEHAKEMGLTEEDLQRISDEAFDQVLGLDNLTEDEMRLTEDELRVIEEDAQLIEEEVRSISD